MNTKKKRIGVSMTILHFYISERKIFYKIIIITHLFTVETNNNFFLKK